jgi:hypothetical protein
MKWDEPEHLRLRMLRCMDRYLDEGFHESLYHEYPETWIFSYDSDADVAGKPFGEHGMSRTIILDTNDDGYFVSLHAKFGLWGCDDGDEYTFEGLVMIGSDDENFQVIPTEGDLDA